MRCPKCGNQDDKVIDSRAARNGAAIRRRRMCLACNHRFTTYEGILRTKLRVVKRDGRHEDFDRKKLVAGLQRACEKRPVGDRAIEAIVDSILDQVENEFESEVPTEVIGRLVMERLEKIDEVAYVRFASVYKRFRDVNQFIGAIQGLMDKGGGTPAP